MATSIEQLRWPEQHPRISPVAAPAVARRHELSRAMAASASLAILLLATMVLLGWWLDSPLLKSGIPGLVAMNPVTAVAFILACISIWLLRTEPVPFRHRLGGSVAAASVILLALLSLSRLYSPWDVGVDGLLLKAKVSVLSNGLPNRMAPNTGLSFLLLGSALLLLDYRTRRGWRPALGLVVIPGALGLVAALGYLYHSSLLNRVSGFNPMAANTALGFLVLSAGVLCARPGEGLLAVFMGPGPGRLLAWRLLPTALILPLLLGWLRLQGEQAELFDSAAGVALMVTATTLIIAGMVWRSATLLNQADLARTRAEMSLRELNEQLETRVSERTRELERVNAELRTEAAERVKSGHELRRTSDELRALFEESPLAISSVSLDGQVRSWNRAAERLFGWTAEEVIGQGLPNVPVELRDEHGELSGRVLSGQPFTNHETRRLRKDGQLCDVSLSTAALHDSGGAVRGIVIVYGDIGDRRGLEAQLRQAQKMDAVGRLAGGVAHDFNNMLTVIRTAAEFLVTDLAEKDPRRGDAVNIRDAANRAVGLTGQLLAFSRQQVLQPRVLDLNAVIGAVEPMVRRLVEENIAVVSYLAAGLDRVKADPSQLDQVILNLVVNGRDAMPEGGTLLIETSNVVLDEEYPRMHLTARPGPHVLLSVTDTGCGMDAGTQARIFEPFFTTKSPGKGTGLGLATVYGIVKQSGGHIWVYSEVGQGTSFKIYFPRHTGPAEAEAQPRAGQDVREERNTGARILVVEDDAAVRGSVRRVLERNGYHVLESANGGNALATLAKSPDSIDLVISDMVMPEMSGLELRHRVKAIRPTLPVLLMSGYSEEAITRLGTQGIIGPMIEKPFTVRGILEKVRAVLEMGASDD